MTPLKKSNVVSYIAFLRLNYGEKSYNYNEEDLEKLTQYWYTQLKPYPKEIVDKAIINCVNTCKIPPTIAHILEIIRNMEESMQKSGIELWTELEDVFYDVANNASKYYYSDGYLSMEKNREIYNNLSPELKTYVKNCGQLVALATAEQKTRDIEKGRFMNNLPEIRKRAKFQEMLPNEFKNLIDSTAKNLQIERKE